MRIVGLIVQPSYPHRKSIWTSC